MANRKVSVWKYVRVSGKWRYCRPVIGANNKIKPHFVIARGKVEHHLEGNYYIHFLEGNRQVWKKIGKNAADAVAEADFKEGYFDAIARGIPVRQNDDKPPVMVGYTLPNYLEEYRLSQRPESYALMKQTLNEFNGFIRKNIISQITRLDLLKYKAWLVERGRSQRTAGNKMLRVNQYLRKVQELKPGEGLVTVKDAKFVELEPEVYSEAELKAFFKACNTFQMRVFKCLLMSGLRKQELESLTWENVNFSAGTLSVTAKAGFSPKTWEERTIEVPAKLLRLLKLISKKSAYVFANGNGNKYTHIWDDCKSIAQKAGVRGAHPHKFRATYATTLLQQGVDLKTVQKLLGHKSLESTMRYLARAQSHEVRAKVDAIWK
jgi:integrase/recombinase XerD